MTATGTLEVQINGTEWYTNVCETLDTMLKNYKDRELTDEENNLLLCLCPMLMIVTTTLDSNHELIGNISKMMEEAIDMTRKQGDISDEQLEYYMKANKLISDIIEDEYQKLVNKAIDSIGDNT